MIFSINPRVNKLPVTYGAASYPQNLPPWFNSQEKGKETGLIPLALNQQKKDFKAMLFCFKSDVVDLLFSWCWRRTASIIHSLGISRVHKGTAAPAQATVRHRVTHAELVGGGQAVGCAVQ